MRYIIDCFDTKTKQRFETITNVNEITEGFFDTCYLIVYDSIMKDSYRVDDWEDWEGYYVRMERSQWLSKNPNISNRCSDGTEEIIELVDKYKDENIVEEYNAVNPAHYKSYVDDYQWIETMARIPTLRNPDRFQAALEMQVRGYLDRRERKDDTLQELKKARFYLQYWISYIENEYKPVSAEEVHTKLGE